MVKCDDLNAPYKGNTEEFFRLFCIRFMSAIIRFAEINEYPEILTHYEACNYHGGVQDADKIVIAVDGQIVGAVRICLEHGIKVLRGMQISPAWQRKGIGSSMLKFLADHVDLDGCYCLPFKYLKLFYGAIGFEEISIGDAPEFLSERLEKYLSLGHEQMVVMAVNKNK
jgi:GNAT superfamily N-acetyltransferase